MAKTDYSKEIRRAVDTGKVIFGSKESEISLKNGFAKLLILSNNAPKLSKEKLVLLAKKAKVPLLEFEGKSNELGSVCGKPFGVSSMVVENEGKSKILEIAKK